MRRLLLSLAVPALAMASPSARADTIKVLTSGAFKQIVVAMVPAFEARTGNKVAVENDTAGALAKRIAGGEAFDVLVLTPGGLKPLAEQGVVDAASVISLAKVGVGVAVKAGAPQPKIATVDDFKQAIVAAHKVAYIDPAAGGSSGIYLDGLFKRLGLADVVRAKAVLVPGGLVAERLVTGEADLAVHQISEILPVPGVTLVGPLPESIQSYTTYAAAASKTSGHPEAARAFLDTLSGPDAARIMHDKGMTPAK